MLAQGVSVAVRLGLLVLLTATVPPPPSPVGASDVELSAFLQKLGQQRQESFVSTDALWERLDLEPPLEVISRVALESPEPAHAVSALQARYALNPRAARLLLSGYVFVEETGYDWQEVPTLAERTLDAWDAAAREAPGNLVVLASLLDWTPRYSHPGFHTRFWQALEHAPHPVETALQLARASETLGPWNASLLRYAISRTRSPVHWRYSASRRWTGTPPTSTSRPSSPSAPAGRRPHLPR